MVDQRKVGQVSIWDEDPMRTPPAEGVQRILLGYVIVAGPAIAISGSNGAMFGIFWVGILGLVATTLSIYLREHTALSTGVRVTAMILLFIALCAVVFTSFTRWLE